MSYVCIYFLFLVFFIPCADPDLHLVSFLSVRRASTDISYSASWLVINSFSFYMFKGVFILLWAQYPAFKELTRLYLVPPPNSFWQQTEAFVASSSFIFHLSVVTGLWWKPENLCFYILPCFYVFKTRG